MTGKSQLYIRYVPTANEEISLNDLGKSLVGFHSSLEKLVKTSSINGKVEIKATKLRSGSIIVDLVIEVISSSPIIFENAKDLVDFASVVGGTFYNNVLELTSQVPDVHRAINDYAANNPVDYDIFKWIGEFILGSLLIAKAQKVLTPMVDGKNIPSKIAKKTHKLIRNNDFRKPLLLFIEGEVSKIEISSDRNFAKKVEITEENFGDFLSEDQKILPDWKNGEIKTLAGKITAIQSNRGDSMTFHIESFPKHIKNFVLFPSAGKTTEDFREFYKEEVSISVEIFRKSDYQKPKLILEDIWITQSQITAA